MQKGELLFGTAGVPHSAKGRDSASGIERVGELGLGAMELEFVRGVNMGRETAKLVGKAGRKNAVALSVHAPYYINLNSEEKSKREASRKRIMDSARIGEVCGAEIVTFHPAYYGKSSGKSTMKAVEEALGDLLEGMRGMKIRLAPETTGKGSQFGSLDETLELCRRLKEIEPMVDWAHLHARGNGCLKNAGDFGAEIRKIPGKFLKRLHMHVSGINYSAKGERNHLNMKESDFNYIAMLEALEKNDVKGIVISESPNLEQDALLMKEYYGKI